MIEEFSDMRAAYDRAQHLNQIAGRREYVVKETSHGWVVRREFYGMPRIYS